MTADPNSATPADAPQQLYGEHHVQVSLLKALRDAVERGDASPEVDETLAQLADFSQVHFSSEQLLMRLCGYDQYAHHLEEHERAMAKLNELRQRLRADDAAGARACLETFSSWLTEHIHNADGALSRHLRSLEA